MSDRKSLAQPSYVQMRSKVLLRYFGMGKREENGGDCASGHTANDYTKRLILHALLAISASREGLVTLIFQVNHTLVFSFTRFQ